jgi:hypothetical protein
VGEFPTPTNLVGVSMTTNTPTNVASISLTAGDWDVTGVVTYLPAASTVIQGVFNGISAVSATLPSANTGGYSEFILTFATGQNQAILAPVVRLTLATTTTIYLVGQANFTTSTCAADGFIRARRVR